MASRLGRGSRALLLLCAAIATGILARMALDAIIDQFPSHARNIDVIGQFLVALGIVWFCLIPVFEDYGIIRRPRR